MDRREFIRKHLRALKEALTVNASDLSTSVGSRSDETGGLATIDASELREDAKFVFGDEAGAAVEMEAACMEAEERGLNMVESFGRTAGDFGFCVNGEISQWVRRLVAASRFVNVCKYDHLAGAEQRTEMQIKVPPLSRERLDALKSPKLKAEFGRVSTVVVEAVSSAFSKDSTIPPYTYKTYEDEGADENYSDDEDVEDDEGEENDDAGHRHREVEGQSARDARWRLRTIGDTRRRGGRGAPEEVEEEEEDEDEEDDDYDVDFDDEGEEDEDEEDDEDDYDEESDHDDDEDDEEEEDDEEAERENRRRTRSGSRHHRTNLATMYHFIRCSRPNYSDANRAEENRKNKKETKTLMELAYDSCSDHNFDPIMNGVVEKSYFETGPHSKPRKLVVREKVVCATCAREVNFNLTIHWANLQDFIAWLGPLLVDTDVDPEVLYYANSSYRSYKGCGDLAFLTSRQVRILAFLTAYTVNPADAEPYETVFSELMLSNLPFFAGIPSEVYYVSDQSEAKLGEFD